MSCQMPELKGSFSWWSLFRAKIGNHFLCLSHDLTIIGRNFLSQHITVIQFPVMFPVGSSWRQNQLQNMQGHIRCPLVIPCDLLWSLSPRLPLVQTSQHWALIGCHWPDPEEPEPPECCDQDYIKWRWVRLLISFLHFTSLTWQLSKWSQLRYGHGHCTA